MTGAGVGGADGRPVTFDPTAQAGVTTAIDRTVNKAATTISFARIVCVIIILLLKAVI